MNIEPNQGTGAQIVGWCSALVLALASAPVLAAGQGPALAPPGYGWAVAKLLVALLVACGASFVLLHFLRRMLLRGRAGLSSTIKVIERCPLSPRQSLWLVEVAGRFFLLGSTDAAVTRLAELDPGSLPPHPRATPSFGEILRRAAGARGGGPEGRAGGAP